LEKGRERLFHYEAVRTPYKYGLVLAPQRNDEKFDCPSVFREGKKWLMTYVRYNGQGGTDGRGYETWLAESNDLLHWRTQGRVLAFGDHGWDMNQRGGFPALVDNEWGGSHRMQKYKGRHWMTYIGGNGTGYEAVNAPLSIGLASTKGDISKAHLWETADKPILSYNDADAQWWEQLTQYKSTIYWDKRKTLGHPFVMYYNAGGKDETHPKGERIGIALSDDMLHWTRYAGNPVFAHDSDGTITGDAQIVRMGDVYVMFYFSAFNPTRAYKAFNTFAVSRDLVHWTDWTGPDLITPSKSYDELFAHKSCVISHGGTVYHFYCAVNNAGQRGIALATSRRMGESEVAFPAPSPTGQRYTSSLNDDWAITLAGKTIHKNIPINLDDYYGCLQQEHGNLHGEAVFVKHFRVPSLGNKQYFIRFEGVGTYADIALNGKNLGHYDIGRTTQTVCITDAVRQGADNELTVRVSHPQGITDMPWVCGGCNSEWGFSEGSQPFGIFRPVTLEATDNVRIEPFGVHVWNQTADSLFIETELRNYSSAAATVALVNKMTDADGRQVVRLTDSVTIGAGETKIVRQQSTVTHPHLWSTDDPYLYHVSTIIKRDGHVTDDVSTPFGIRTISWPVSRGDGDGRFFVNGKPVFINGVCEYEHEFGQSHAFSDEQIDARVKEVTGAGFNAFRDAHQPHNLRYNQWWDKKGILWWPQYSAHIWFDTPQFRESFKRHLVQWVKERRNSPSLVLWGLQNESVLPADFARECADIIRSMDPTCGMQRLITTCNGGEGTDWNVVQNWSGTYGGDIDNYGNELKRRDQLLNGEYGAWRTIGNHSDKGYTEEKYADVLERKLMLAESVRDSVCGHFLWLLASHDNPGRRQPDEALRRVDKVGPYNYKGLFSPWEQPTDAYYMYKAHEVPSSREPFVCIVPSSRGYYSNCDSVRLHRFDTFIAAAGYVGGRIVATDTVALAGYQNFDESLLRPAKGFHYLYRLNCGGDDYTDSFGNRWMQDNTRWSHSWGERFAGTSPYQTSQVNATKLTVSPLLRTSRFGRHDLSFRFPAAKGDYRVEMYFVEPWYGEGGSEKTDCEGLRLFDVAINDSVVIPRLDIWAQAGYGHPYKRAVDIHHNGGEIKIDFPHVLAGQAMIAAIAIATKDKVDVPVIAPSPTLWAQMDADTLVHTPDSLLPARTSANVLQVEGERTGSSLTWNFSVGIAKIYSVRWRYANPEKSRRLHVRMTDAKGVVVKDDDITFVQTPENVKKRRTTSITTGTQVNAGRYLLVLSGEGIDKMTFDKITVE
jgi:hypothetical protein